MTALLQPNEIKIAKERNYLFTIDIPTTVLPEIKK